jgi:NADPH:quinone reductase
MKAVVFEKTGAPLEVLKIYDTQAPEPGAGEVRIKMLTSPINPADTLFIGGKYRIKPQFPQVAGLEGVGIIEKIPEGSVYSLNTLVAFRYKGLWADLAIVPEEKLIPLPSGYPLEKAAQLSLNPITAYALLDEANLQKNDWLLINAGNSGMSRIILQLAALRGIHTIVVTRNDKETYGLDQLGATHVISLQQGGLAQKMQG